MELDTVYSGKKNNFHEKLASRRESNGRLLLTERDEAGGGPPIKYLQGFCGKLIVVDVMVECVILDFG